MASAAAFSSPQPPLNLPFLESKALQLGYPVKTSSVNNEEVQEVMHIMQQHTKQNPEKRTPFPVIVDHIQTLNADPIEKDILAVAALALGFTLKRELKHPDKSTGTNVGTGWCIDAECVGQSRADSDLEAHVKRAKEEGLLHPNSTFESSKIREIMGRIQGKTEESERFCTLRELAIYIGGFSENISEEELLMALFVLGYTISKEHPNSPKYTTNLKLSERSTKDDQLAASMTKAYELGILGNEQVVISIEQMTRTVSIMRGSTTASARAAANLLLLTDFLQPFDGSAIPKEEVAVAALILGHEPSKIDGEWVFDLELSLP